MNDKTRESNRAPDPASAADEAPRIIERLPRPIREIEHAWITLADGTRLAARIWMPEGASENPVPAILEYIPYRKRDLTAVRDSMNHRYFASRGYASVRVDLRGSGDSEGVLKDEYLQQELDDGVEVINWIADQEWCDGAVGMIGISWGGFNGLQIAAMQPEPLKAIITVCSTDDRYADDVHYMGGCLLGDNLSWAGVMFAYNACPPDPALVGDAWRDMWLERLEGSGLWIANWLEHQARDEFWRHGSVCEDFSKVRVPVLAASGWTDGYTDAVFRLLENLSGPRLGLVGPWGHKYPHVGVPGPAIGFLQEAVRWWDRWLKGDENGVDKEPMLRAWMQDAVGPYTRYAHRPGRWVAEPAWPSGNIEFRQYALDESRALIPTRDSAFTLKGSDEAFPVESPLSVGFFAGKWCSYAAAPDLPGDQREEDGGSLVFESEPLAEDLEILGAPHLDIEVSTDRPVAMLAARLSDIGAGRKATRITYGLLNLTHRDGDADPKPIEPGKRHRVRLNLNHTAQTFRKGHRIRVSISTSYWPLAWPPPEPACVTVHTGHSALTLPVRAPRAEDREVVFDPPETAPPIDVTVIEPGQHSWRVIRDLEANQSTLEVIADDGVTRFNDIDLEVKRCACEWYRFTGDDFTSVEGEVKSERCFQRGADSEPDSWIARAVTHTILRCTEDAFIIQADLDAWEGDARIFSRSWRREIPRYLV